MKKIMFAAAAVLAISTSAFAGSDNYGSKAASQPAVSVDTRSTGSVSETRSIVHDLLNSSDDVQKPVQHGSDRNLFGR